MQPTYFASGSNTPGEIRGLSDVGCHVGVAVPEIAAPSLAQLLQAKGLVFCDSGAFSEVAFGPTGITVVAPMSDKDWTGVFELYSTLAATLGSRLFPVAPDRVGDQAVTLARLTTWASEIRRLRALGVRWIVPIQKGQTSMADFHAQIVEVLGFSDFVCGIPSKKDATSVQDLASFVQAVKPGAVHLLGLGPRGKGYAERLALLDGVTVSCDSVAIRTMVGRTNGPGGGPRAFTAAQDVAEDELAYETWGATDGMAQVDYTDEVSSPSDWMTPAAFKTFVAAIAQHMTDLPSSLEDVDTFVGLNYQHPIVELEIDRAWQAWNEKRQLGEKKRRGIISVFSKMPEYLAA